MNLEWLFMSPKRAQKYVTLINDPLFFFSKKKLLSNHVVFYLLKALESADAGLTADIENDLVNIGDKAIMPLLVALESPNSKVQKHAAMALIRIGNQVIVPLLNEYRNKPDRKWMVDFIISEIQGYQTLEVDKKCFETMAS